jgi:hypothetical protein
LTAREYRRWSQSSNPVSPLAIENNDVRASQANNGVRELFGVVGSPLKMQSALGALDNQPEDQRRDG